MILENFDLKWLKRKCNFKGCKKRPMKDVLLFEIDRRTNTKIILASLYFCPGHCNKIKPVIERLNAMCERWKCIKEETSEIRSVA